MDLDEYVKKSAPAGDQRGDNETAIPDLLICLGRAAVDTMASYLEAGRDRDQRVAIKLGDTLWYVAAVVRRLKLSLSEIAGLNLKGATPATFDDYVSQSAPDDLRDDSAATLLLNGLIRSAADITSNYFHAAQEKDTHIASRLGETLWYLGAVARRLGLSFSAIANANLVRTSELFGSVAAASIFFDEEYDPDEQLPRKVTIKLSESNRNGLPTVRMAVQMVGGTWLPIGSPLNDNAHLHDEYRFHDVLHLAYVAFLGWSPVIRALFGTKRKSNPNVDRVEDGARATLLEEALTGFIYEAASDNHFFENTAQLERRLLLAVKRLTRGLEVKVRTYEDWTSAITSGYRVFREIKSALAAMPAAPETEEARELGQVHVDMNERTIVFEPTPLQR